MGLGKSIGLMLGALFAPSAALGSFVRRARLFHPDGVVHRADVRPLADGALALALSGPAIVRLSGALHRWPSGAHRPDILGIAVRFHPDDPRAQDLLFATFRVTAELPLALLTTDVGDFLANTYSTVLPSRAPGVGRVDFRLVPDRVITAGADRRERLEDAVRAGRARFKLQLRERRLGARHRDLALITLRERISEGADNLRFNPFHAGLGIEPVGLLQAIRAVVYPASQLGRALARRPR